jgi:hypothetical protein
MCGASGIISTLQVARGPAHSVPPLPVQHTGINRDLKFNPSQVPSQVWPRSRCPGPGPGSAGMRVSLCALITWITLAESGLPVFQYVTMTKTHPMLMRHDRIAIGSRLRGGTPVDVEARTEKMKESATFDIVILGGGVAAGYCVKEMIAKGIGSSKVCILTEETCPPYERPALTKGYMLGALPSPHSGGFLCNPSDAYTAQGVEVLTSCKATRIDFENRLITTEYAPSDRSEKVSTTILYKKLVLATGADVERLFVPGNTLANIFYIRSSHIRFCSVEVLGWFGR